MNTYRSQDDIMERLAKLGVSAAKKSAKGIARGVKKQTHDFARTAFESATGRNMPSYSQKESGNTKENYTPLDLKSLGEAYQEQDREKRERLEQLLQKLSGDQSTLEDENSTSLKEQRFRKYKDEERQYYQRRKKEKEDEKKLEEARKLEERKQEEAQKASQEQGEIPKGKKRRSIFAKVKKRRSKPELGVGQGKS